MLKSVINYAIKNDMYDGKNPVSQVKFFKEQRRREYFTPQQVRNILIQAKQVSAGAKFERPKDRPKFYLYPYLLLLSSTGARAGEIINLRWSQVGFDHVILKHTKSGYDRLIPLLPDDVAAIQDLPKTSPYVLDLGSNRHGLPVVRSANRFRHQWRLLMEKMGFGPEYLMHTLRHSFATNMLQIGGMDIRSLQHLLGHSSITVTEGYSHPSHEIQRGAIERYLKGG